MGITMYTLSLNLLLDRNDIYVDEHIYRQRYQGL